MREVLRNFAYKTLVVVGALTLCAATAATSIGTNIQTDGTFAAVGTSTFSGRVGISTTTPGSLFSVGGITNFTSATSTFYSTGGINLTDGCFAVNGTCIGGGTNVNSGWVQISSGTIASPTAYFNVSLPTGYRAFKFFYSGMLAQGGLATALSYDGGTTFLCDPTHDNTYAWVGTEGASSPRSLLWINFFSFLRASLCRAFCNLTPALQAPFQAFWKSEGSPLRAIPLVRETWIT